MGGWGWGTARYSSTESQCQIERNSLQTQISMILIHNQKYL